MIKVEAYRLSIVKMTIKELKDLIFGITSKSHGSRVLKNIYSFE